MCRLQRHYAPYRVGQNTAAPPQHLKHGTSWTEGRALRGESSLWGAGLPRAQEEEEMQDAEPQHLEV